MPNGVNARQQYERYLARVREAQVAGDAVEMENCYQHACAAMDRAHSTADQIDNRDPAGVSVPARGVRSTLGVVGGSGSQ